MGQNRVTIFSNGIADFRRSYSVKKDVATTISIPVRKDHIADVLGSLNVYGAVAMSSPPSFRPSNEADGNLTIDKDQVLAGLATQLVGAKVTIEKGGAATIGRLTGLHTEETANGMTRIVHKFLVVLSDTGFQRVPVSEIQAMRFEDETIQTEIDKALQRNFEAVKPNSTFVDLALTTEQEDAEATVQYAVPAAAWKISYRLRQVADEPFEFQGFAIVDNNTEEDWNEFLVSVVTGEPITFSTDLADSKTPRRKHVNVVRDEALGAVEVEESMVLLSAAGGAAAAMPAPAPAGGRTMMRKSRGRHFSREDLVDGMAMETADTEDAEVREVGDFCVFEAATPVSIGANRSSVIPVFNTTLGETRVVLHYKEENHSERPYRAIEFKNETAFSLGRGVCTVFQNGDYSGSCVMPATKPGTESLLPHALETSVRIQHEKKRLRRKAVGIRLTEGYCYTSYHETQKTLYHIVNNRDEAFRLVLDHDHQLQEPDVKCLIQRPNSNDAPYDVSEQLSGGFRARIDLEPGDRLDFIVTESRIQESSVRLVYVTAKQEQLNVHWLRDNLVVANGPLADDPGIRACLEIQRRLDAKKDEIKKSVEETDRLAARQERLRKNIKTGGHDDQTSQWKTGLGNAEDKIVDLEEQVIPKLRAEEKQIRRELHDAMMVLAAEWKAS